MARGNCLIKSSLFLLLLFFGNFFIGFSFATIKTPPKKVTEISIDNRSCGLLCIQSTVQNKDKVLVDNNQYSRLYASPGILGPLGSYKGIIELEFEEEIPANTWSYVRIKADSNLLQSLLGGSLVNTLGNVLGAVLLGKQEIEIQARNSVGAVLTRNSTQEFSTERVKLVQDGAGDYFLAIKPEVPYNKIRITNQASALAGLGAEYTLDVYHAFYFTPDPCDVQPAFTSFDGSGITLEALGLNKAVEDLNLAIDGDQENTFSEISLGVLGVGASTEQKIYFESPVQPGNEILISMAKSASLLDLGLLNNVELVAYSNGAVVSATTAASLLELDVLGLLASNQFFKFPISDSVSAIDQIGIRVTSLVGVGALSGNLKISGVTVAPVRPEIPDVSEEGVFVICYGQTEFIEPVNKAGGELSWYRVEAGSEVFINIAETYTTPDDLPVGEHEFLVRAKGASCDGESSPSIFKVLVTSIPTEANYNVLPSGEIGIDEEGKYTYVEGINPVILNPDLINWTGEGNFEWFLDEAMQDEIENGALIDDVLFQVEEGELTMTGLKFRDELDPYKFYLNWVPVKGCGPESPMEFDLSSVARILNVSLLDFDARVTFAQEVAVNWKFSNQKISQQITVQRANSDLVFQNIWQAELANHVDFKFSDTNPLPGNSYYRLQVSNLDGEVDFTSDLRRVTVDKASTKSFLVYPNHFEDSFSISTTHIATKDISYFMYSGDGSLVLDGVAKISGQNPINIVGFASHSPGEYFLIITENGRSHTYHLIKN